MDWFKFYGKDFMVDPKIRRLSAIHQLMYVYMLCYASTTDDGVIEYLTEDILAAHCNLTPLDEDYKKTRNFITTVKNMGMVDVVGDSITVIKYLSRQQRQMTDAERAKRYRDRKKEQDSDVRHEDNVTNVTIDKSRVDKNRIDKNHYSSPSGDGSSEYSNDFLQFWQEYPRKVGKGAAYRSWLKIKGIKKSDIIEAVKSQREQEQWKKDNGQYIPHPTTWLNQRRWEDEVRGPRKAVVIR